MRLTKLQQALAEFVSRKGTQKKAARAIGVPFPTFRDWLYGQRRPGAAARALIAERIKGRP